MTFKLALLTTVLALAIIGCGEQAEQAVPAGEPVSASPTPAAGVPQEELDTRKVVSQLGIAARNIVDADDLAAARDAVGVLEQQMTEAGETLPEGFGDMVEDDLQSIRDAVAADDLAAAKVAAQALIVRMRESATLTDPTLVRPEGEAPAETPAT